MAKKQGYGGWHRQPIGPVGINWGHPRAEGLAFFAPLSGAHGTLDLVRRQLGARTGLEAYLPSQVGAIHHLFGSSNTASFPEVPPEIGPNTPFTVAWTQEPRSPSGYGTVLNINFGTGGVHSAFLIYQGTVADAYRFAAGPRIATGAHSWATAINALTDQQLDRFVLVALAGSQSTTRTDFLLYRNGVLISQDSSGSFGANTTAAFLVGSLASNADPFEGLIGDMRMWSRVLSDGEIEVESTVLGSWDLYAPRRIWVPVSASGTIHTVDLTEAFSSTDSASSARTLAVSSSEAASVADTIAAASAAVAALIEAASATDAQAAVNAGAASLAEAASAADAQTAARVQAAAATEAATATDAQAATLTAARSVTEAASASDLVAALALAVAAVSEAISATDAQSSEPIVTASLTEPASAADSASVIATLAAALSESASAGDAITAAALLVSTLLESVNAADAATTAAQLVALLTESASLADVQSTSTATVHEVSIEELALALDLVAAAIADAIPGTTRYTITARPRRLQLTAAHRRLEINR